ncbi:FtsX-like permease family protein [Actinosynnema sp. NPDC051121]|nr:FtsX-like permease family protein [Saccharothrix sp.]
MTGWRAALRIARREARRAKGRSGLVVAMIALPVAALSFGAVYFATFTLLPDERAEREMGTAQALIRWTFDGPVRQEPEYLAAVAEDGTSPRVGQPTAEQLLGLLPPGTRLVPDQGADLTVRTTAGLGSMDARLLDYADPLAGGILRQVSGRAPSSDDEVALTARASGRIGAGIGDQVRSGDDRGTFRVVGIVEDPTRLDAETIVLRPGAAVPPENRRAPTWLAATPGPLTWAEVKDLNRRGAVALSRHVLAHPPGADERYPSDPNGAKGSPAGAYALVIGLAVVEVVLLAGPAFAVGVRRRQRDLALVSAAGGTPAHVRRIVLADGVVLGAVAAAAGVVLGVVAAAVARPLLEVYGNSRSGAFRVFAPALLATACLAVVTGVLAALVPAWISSRQDVVVALGGRRGITRSSPRWLLLGVALVVIGAVVASVGAWRVDFTTIIGGVVVGVLGLVLCTPAVVGLVARLGPVLPLPLRIALRDTSRNRTAAAPAISAVMAVVLVCLAIGVVLDSSTGHDRDSVAGRPGDVTVHRAAGGERPALSDGALTTLRGLAPIEQVHRIGLASCAEGPCPLRLRMPADRDCPYSRHVLGREPDPDEQRAARRDARCEGVGTNRRYFGRYDYDSAPPLVVDPAAAPALLTRDADLAAASLRDGAVVVDDSRYLDHSGRVTLTAPGAGGGPERVVTARAVALPQRAKAPVALMTEQTARSLGLGSTPLTTLATTSRPPTVEERDHMQAALGAEFVVHVEIGGAPDGRPLTVLALVAAMVTIGASALATGLTAADSRADLATLAAVGASPRLRRMLSLSQSGVIAGLGSLLGAAAGVGTAVAVLTALNQRYADQWPAPVPFPVTVPWVEVGVAVVVVPLVAMAGAGLLTRSRLPIERPL